MPADHGVVATDDGRADLLRRGLRLEFATLGWNVAEIGFLLVNHRDLA